MGTLIHDYCSARPKDRDSVDQRLVTEFKNDSGGFVDSQTAVGGYPTATATTRPPTVPATNVDAWLASMAAELE